MTDFFIDDTATGTDSGADWANAFVSFTQLLASAFTAGDKVFVANTHTDGLVADTTLTFPGTLAAPNEIYSVDNTGSPEPPDNTDLLAGAQIDCTNDLTLNGSFYMHGVTIQSGTTSSGSGDDLKLSSGRHNQHYEECDISSQSSSASAVLEFGRSDATTGTRATILLTNCILGQGNSGSEMAVFNARVTWRNKAGKGVAIDIASARHANPTNGLFRFSALASEVILDGLDFSNLSNLDGMFNVSDDGGCPGGTMSNCKLNATFSLTTGARTHSAFTVPCMLVNCDDGDTNYLFEFDNRSGNIVTDTAKTLNATDGTTAFGWKMVASADADFFFPLYTPWIPVWVDSTGSKTVTLEFLHDGGVTNLNDDEVWIEVMHALNTADPLYGLVTDRMVPLATPAAQTDSVEGDWTEDLVNENAQKAVTASITVNEKGLIYARLALAKPSQTIWVDPDPVVA